MQVAELVGVQLDRQAVALRRFEHALDLLRRETDAFAKAVNRVGQPFGGECRQHLVGDAGDVGIGIAVRLRRQRMRAKEGAADADRAQLAEAARGAQRLAFGSQRKPVTGLDLDRRQPFGDQRIESRQRLAHEARLVGFAQLAHRGIDAAAGARDLLVAGAAQPQLELMRAVAGVDQMRVAIDQAGRDPAALTVDHLDHFSAVAQRRRQRGFGPGIGDATIAHGERAMLDDAQPRLLLRQRRQPYVAPQPIARRGLRAG